MTHKFLLAVVLCLAVCLASPALAQESPDRPQDDISRLFDSSGLHDQLSAMMVKVLDAYLDFLARPQTAEKLATFQKNYYDALIRKGFSGEQAFQLVRDVGNPLGGLSNPKAK